MFRVYNYTKLSTFILNQPGIEPVNNVSCLYLYQTFILNQPGIEPGNNVWCLYLYQTVNFHPQSTWYNT